jgi:hypothetical protein
MVTHPSKERTFPPTHHGAMTRYVFRRHTVETHAGRAGPRFEVRAITPPEEEALEGYTIWQRARR